MDRFVLICTGISLMKLLLSVLQKFGPFWIVLLLEAWSRNRQNNDFCSAFIHDIVQLQNFLVYKSCIAGDIYLLEHGAI